MLRRCETALSAQRAESLPADYGVATRRVARYDSGPVPPERTDIKPKHATWSLGVLFCGVHALAVLLLLGFVAILDAADVINLFEYALGALVVLLFMAPLFGLWWSGLYVRRHNRRVAYPYCPSCLYNLTGNNSGRCPECGQIAKDSEDHNAGHRC